jgi:uncharacterized protein (DUF305 family)
MPSRSLPTPLLLAAALFAGGCAARGPVEATPGPATMSAAEIESLYRARIDSARTRFTDADVRFMTGMIAHHAQALAMAALVPDRAASPSIRTLAARIVNAQQDEIAIMQRWLRERDQPVPELHGRGADVAVHGAGHAHGAAMPGMLSEAQLRGLAAASGPAFDRLFLELMIQHHRGAVTMVRDLFATEGAGQGEQAFRLATDIHVDQATEIARMERMLEALPEPPSPRNPS